VYCPFAWDGWLPSAGRGTGRARQPDGAGDLEREPEPPIQLQKPLRFHDREAGNRLCVDLGSERYEEHRSQAQREELAERVRLFYVALTRARHRCTFVWGAAGDAATSATAWLLHQPVAWREAGPPDHPLDGLREHFARLTDAELLGSLV